MSGRNFGYLKVNRRGKEKIVILSILLISFLLAPFLNNFNIYNKLDDNEKYHNKDENIVVENLKTQALTTDNTFSGIGAAWNVSHWANRTDYNLPVSFGNGSSDTVNMDLGGGWEGYQLKGTIKDLYDTRNWINGTFHAGPDDGNDIDDFPEDDSNDVLNWTYNFYDNITNINAMSGNYFNSTNDPSGTGNDCLELKIVKSGNAFDINDRCWWNSSFKIPRGKVISGDIYLSVYPHTVDDLANVFNLEIYINDEFVYGIGLYTIKLIAEGQNWVDLIISLENFLDNSKIFPNPINNTNMNITVQLKTLTDVPSSMGQNMGDLERILFDNVSLVLQTEIKPELIGLKMNNLPVSNIDWGKGTVEQISTWNMTPVEVKFNSTEVRPSEMGGYDVEFKTDINLFAKKMNTDSHYEPNLFGTNFEVSNDSSVEWESYARVSVPTGYKETNMTIEFPEDVNITWISNAEYPNTNILKYCDNSTLGILKVYNFSETPDGFWWVKGESPNYCSELNIYNNVTGSWVLNNIFLSGDYINVTGKIVSPDLDISNYVNKTNAYLYIRFPNGTIWTAADQIKQVNTNGIVYFDPFQIPNSPPDYEVGEYQAIITWNNSYSNFNLNETGLIYKTFTVSHNSSLEPDQYYYPDIFVGDIVNIKVSFNDLENIKPIEKANVYVKNFTGGTQYFNEINPGYYFLEFNTTGGIGGDQNLTIYANHPSYEDNKVNVTIGLIGHTSLTAEEYPSIKVPWNNNFTIHLNYTETSTGNGIEAATTTVYWNSDAFIDSANGIYNVSCNSSAYQVNDVHNLKIELNKTGYESQTLIISIEVVERETYIDEIFINDVDCTANKSYNIHSGELMNITVKYKDTEKSGAFIPNAMVTLNGTNIGKIFTDNNVFNYYNLTVNSTKLSVGINLLNIIAKKENYSALTELITINVFERNTNWMLFLNGTDKTADPSIRLYDNQLLNITVSYTDSIDVAHIPNAIVDINGSGISEILAESFDNYSVLINTTDLDQGANFLTIFIRKDGYEAHSILLIIEIIQIETNLTLFLEGVDKTSSPSITLYPTQTLNITISYTDFIAVAHIPNAIVDINGSGISEILAESFNNYSVVINTTDLNQGANLLTIFVRKDGYEAHSILLIIEIIQIETDLTLFLDGVDKTSNPSITLYPTQTLNITISYTDFIAVAHIPNAIVDINGSGISEILVETFNNYSVLINMADLNQGINFLTIFVRKDGYEAQTILLIIEIIQIETDLTLFLDNDPITLDPVIEVMIGNILNLTVYYTDNETGFPITGALVQLIGEGDTLNFTEGSNQYSIYLNTTNLKIGVSLFTIVAQADNFQVRTIELRITTTRIKITTSTFSGEPYETGSEGGTIRLRIILNNTNILPSGGFIKNAIVTYKWTYGQGELTEYEGIYEVDLVNLPSGTYIITITASAGDDYTFETYEITLNVVSVTPPDFSMLIIILAGAFSALVIGFTLYEVRFKYPATVRKSRKIRKKIRKGKKTKPIKDIASREDLIKDHLESNIETIQLEKKTENGFKEK